MKTIKLTTLKFGYPFVPNSFHSCTNSTYRDKRIAIKAMCFEHWEGRPTARLNMYLCRLTSEYKPIRMNLNAKCEFIERMHHLDSIGLKYLVSIISIEYEFKIGRQTFVEACCNLIQPLAHVLGTSTDLLSNAARLRTQSHIRVQGSGGIPYIKWLLRKKGLQLSECMTELTADN